MFTNTACRKFWRSVIPFLCDIQALRLAMISPKKSDSFPQVSELLLSVRNLYEVVTLGNVAMIEFIGLPSLYDA